MSCRFSQHFSRGFSCWIHLLILSSILFLDSPVDSLADSLAGFACWISIDLLQILTGFTCWICSGFTLWNYSGFAQDSCTGSRWIGSRFLQDLLAGFAPDSLSGITVDLLRILLLYSLNRFSRYVHSRCSCSIISQESLLCYALLCI